MEEIGLVNKSRLFLPKNFRDRTGVVKFIYFVGHDLKGPFKHLHPIAGIEAVGEVVAMGPGLTGIKVGDLVAYAGNPMGSYAEEQILPASVVVPVPPSIDPIIAASVIVKGMTAQVLVRHCFKVSSKHVQHHSEPITV